MEKVHKHKSERKRKLSLEDSEIVKDTACHESRSDTPKTKKKKMIDTINTDPSCADLESGNISHVKKQKKRSSHNKVKIDEKDETVTDKTSEESQEGDATEMKHKKKSKKKDKDKEHKSSKGGIVETTAHESDRKQLETVPDDRLEIQEGSDAQVKKKKKSKKKSQDKRSLGMSPENLQKSSLDGAEKCDEEESKIAPTKTLKDQEEDDTEKTKKKKSKKSKVKDKVENSLGTVDNELVESTAKNLQINGLDVSNTDSSKDAMKDVGNTDSSKETNNNNENLSSEKQKKKKKKKKDQQAAKKDDKKSDQNVASVNRPDRALNYLRLWNLDKASWKFNKMNQTQLLHMIYDTSLVNEDDFQILLLYLADLKGQAKEKTHKQAMKLVNGDAENGEEVSTVKEQRAREIVQVLS